MVAGDPPTPHAYTGKRLIIDPNPHRWRRFPIPNDDIDVARGLAADLVQLRFEATAFATEAQLEATTQFLSFDPCVIDGVLPNGAADQLLPRLCSQNATCPTALLTGKADKTDIDERKLVAAIKKHGQLFLQKPATISIAASWFRTAFANR